MSFTQMILDQGNYIIIPRPLIKFMGIEKAVFLLWMINHYQNIKKKLRKKKDFFYDAGIIEKQTGLSLYTQNKVIEELTEWNILKVTGRNRHNRKTIKINHKIMDALIVELYLLNIKEESYEKFKKSLMKNLISNVGSSQKFNKLINKTKVLNKPKREITVRGKPAHGLIIEKPSSFGNILVVKLEDALLSKRKLFRRVNKAQWILHFNNLHFKLGVKKKEIKKVLSWYIRHIGEEFVPVAYSAKTFCDKYPQIRDAMLREEPEGPKTTIISRRVK